MQKIQLVHPVEIQFPQLGSGCCTLSCLEGALRILRGSSIMDLTEITYLLKEMFGF